MPPTASYVDGVLPLDQPVVSEHFELRLGIAGEDCANQGSDVDGVADTVIDPSGAEDGVFECADEPLGSSPEGR